MKKDQELTVKELREAKECLDRRIRDAVNEFNCNTKISIKSISIDMINAYTIEEHKTVVGNLEICLFI